MQAQLTTEWSVCKLLFHLGVSLLIVLAACVMTLIRNHDVIAEELQHSADLLRNCDCELQSRILMSDKVNVGLLFVRLPE